MILTNAKIVLENKIIEGTIYIKDNKIFNITNKKDPKGIDVKGNYIIPGFIDVHTHGGYGYDFMNYKDAPKLAKYKKEIFSEGVTSVVATTMTKTKSDIKNALSTISKEITNDSLIIGVHLEGPFISKDKCGAQRPGLVLKPNINLLNEFNKEAKNNIMICTLAIENDTNYELLKHLTRNKIIGSAGHSVATFDQCVKALKFGLIHATHLFNAMSGFDHRHPGIVAAAFDTKKIMCELICDGIHIHRNTIKTTYDILGKEKILLITDSMEAKGMKDGIYEIGGLKVNKVGYTAKLKGKDTLAGSVASFIMCFKNIIEFTGCGIIEAVHMASTNQAKHLGVFSKYGSIEKNKIANLVILDRNYNVKSTIFNGKKVYGE